MCGAWRSTGRPSSGNDALTFGKVKKMKGPVILSCIVIAIMSALMANILINDSMSHGVGFDVFFAARDPWQMFINNDLVTGLLFMCGWIILREKGGRTIDTIAWVLMVLWWGNVIVAAYVLRASWQSGGDWTRFFLGRHAGPLPRVVFAMPLRVVSGAAAAVVAVWTVRSVINVGVAPVPTVGYVLGFMPVVLSLLLVALPAQPAREAGSA
jgi:hypothetical protein